MSENLDKLKGHSDVKQDINRRKLSDVNGKVGSKLNKRINDISKVITDPDVWNVNIASRERMDVLEEQLKDLITDLKDSLVMLQLILSLFGQNQQVFLLRVLKLEGFLD